MSKHTQKIRLQEKDGLYEVELVEKSRKRITSEDELRAGIANILVGPSLTGYDGLGGTRFAEPVEVRAARMIVSYLKTEPRILSEFIKPEVSHE